MCELNGQQWMHAHPPFQMCSVELIMVAIYALIQLNTQWWYIPCVMNQMGFTVANLDWPSSIKVLWEI